MAKQHETLGEVTDAVLAIHRRVGTLCEKLETVEALLDAELNKTISGQIDLLKKNGNSQFVQYQEVKECVKIEFGSLFFFEILNFVLV